VAPRSLTVAAQKRADRTVEKVKMLRHLFKVDALMALFVWLSQGIAKLNFAGSFSRAPVAA
jgi:hypothetical protein